MLTSDITLSDLKPGTWIELRITNRSKHSTVTGWLRAVAPHGGNYWVVFEVDGDDAVTRAVLLSDVHDIRTKVKVDKVVRRPEELYEELHEKLGDQT